MFKKIGRRLSYANVAATLALVFAMSGGALAASHYLITSAKQIKPSVLKQLQGQAGKAGAGGPAGPQGLQGVRGETGPAGGQGPKGETGTAGKNGEPGKNGKNGEPGEPGQAGATGPDGSTGPEGSPWTAGGTLPSGKSEKGQAALTARPVGAEELELASISFPIPLAKALAPGKATGLHLIKGEVTKAGEGCPVGSKVTKPEAEPGNLCVFLFTDFNLKFPEGEESINPEAAVGEQVGKTGVVLTAESEEAGPAKLIVTWAVTAP